MNLKKFAFLSCVAVVTLCSVVAFLVITFDKNSSVQPPVVVVTDNMVIEEVAKTNVVMVVVDPHIAFGTATYEMMPSRFRSPPVVREEEVKRLLLTRPVASGVQ